MTLCINSVGVHWGLLVKFSCNFHKIPIKIEEGRLNLFIFLFIFILFSIYFSIFLFLEQLGLGLIGHTITSVT